MAKAGRRLISEWSRRFAQRVRRLFAPARLLEQRFRLPLRLGLEELEPRTVPSLTPTGSEFQLNASSAGVHLTSPQSPGAVATNSSGETVVTWSSSAADGNGYGVLARVFNSNGVAQSPEIHVNQTTAGNQEYSAVAINSAGGFVVTWSSQNPVTLIWTVYARRFDSQGHPVSGEFAVSANPTVSQQNSTVAMDANGNFVVTWTSQSSPYSNIEAQFYNSSGTAIGSTVQVNQYTGGNQAFSSAAMDSAGDAVITWSSSGQDGGGYGVYAQRYQPGGTAVGTPFLVNNYTTGNQEYSTVAMNPTTGNFVITWSDDTQNGLNWGIYGQRYLANGTASGGEFTISTNTSYAQQYSRVAIAPNGYSLVTWTSNGQDGSGLGIYAQLYDASGAAVGTPFLVNTTTTGNQQYSSIALGTNAVPWIMWSGAGTGGADGVWGQRYALSTGTAQPLTVTGQAIAATEGNAYSGVVASFTDPNSSAVAGDFSATITWGDGSTSTGTVTSNGAGGFNVTASNTYAEAGSYTATISVQDRGTGGTGSGSATATVADGALTGTSTPFSAVEGSSFSGVVANFTDANPNAVATDFSATVTWGDGSTSVGTVASDGVGGFNVTSSKTYAEAASYTFTVSIHDVDGANGSASGTATISDAALSASGNALSAVEGSTYSGVLATFTDGNSLSTTADFSATITWGDGQTSTASISLSAGVFSVSASHAYAEAGSYTVQVAIHDVEGSSATTSATATISDAALSASGHSFSGQEGGAYSGVVATFTDANSLSTAADFSATVTWGDGQTSTASVSLSAGTFSVSASHTYAETGSYAVQVSIHDAQGSNASASATATISDAALTATGQTFSVQEGSAFNGVVATFTDANALATTADFSATVTWGDGQTSTSTITQNAGVFSVSASHTYAEGGSYTVQISIQDVDGSSTSASTTGTVSDAALTATGKAVSLQEGSGFSGVVATFTDANPLATAADFSGTVTWGDGQTSTATITLSAGTFSVSASHTWKEAGSFTIQVSILDAQGSSASTSAAATISDAALTAAGQSFSIQEGSSYSGTLATFTDANPLSTTADFSATITWGDGQTNTATISQNAGVYSVSGSHAYAEAGSYTVQISIHDVEGSAASPTAAATVSDATLTASGHSFAAQEGTAYSGAIATFTDGNALATAADFSATITWGDGQTGTATISLNAGVFSVSASHAYAEAGSFAVQVSIQDAQGSTASASATTTISDAALSASGQPFSVQEGTGFNGVVATFTDANALATSADLTATITWGDGQTATGTITQNAGVFSVSASHTYTEAGSYTVQIVIQDAQGSSASTTATATVSDAALTATGQAVSLQEGSAFSGVAATFTDANPQATAADFSATVTWGDGQTSTATVTLTAGTFSVSASHTWKEAGSYTIQVSILDAQGSSASTSATATISDAALSAAVQSFSVQEGTSYSGVMATFTDANPLSTTADFSATITWGDGQTNTGTISQNAGVYSVSGSHAYAEAGSYTVQISIHDVEGSIASPTASATVSDATLIASGHSFSAQEGTAYSGAIATFTDGNALATAADFSATITWGDGQTSTASVSLSAGVFSVSASHAYAEAGSYAVQVSITDAQGSSASVSATATISDAALSASGQPFSVQEGSGFSGVVATFTDANTLAATADFSTTVTWGDGQTSSGTVTQNAGVFSVSASHTYAEAGSYTVQIAIQDAQGSSASTTATATVSDAALTAAGQAVSLQEGSAFSGVAATFTDANPQATAADFSGTVTWGDGQTSTATITLNAGTFSVSASHTWKEAGSYTIQVSILDAQGSSASTSATATISDAALSAAGQSFSVQEGSSYSGTLATFTDANPLSTAADFSATITWGDGQTSTATISQNAGVFTVAGSHAYAEAGSYAVQVSIHDVEGSTASSSASATISDAPLAASGHAFSAQEGSSYNGVVATFTDANALSTSGDFSATVTWGDGQTSTGSVSLNAGVFSVSASHTYAEAGSYTVQVSIQDAQGSTNSASAAASISDAPLSATAQSFGVQEGSLYSGAVATFTDGNPLSTVTDLSATITWGDGQTSTGSISLNAGVFTVSGSHAYAEAGSYTTQISITDAQGSTASASATATISDAALSASGQAFSAQEGSSYNGFVATFTDANPRATAADLSATVTWGDGQTSTGSISLNAGVFSVSATHAYAEAGSYTVQVSIQDAQGSSTTASAAATISDAPLSASGHSFAVQEGSSYSGIVATFTDANPLSTAGDFSATVAWGDGQTSTGTISLNAGVFSVSASHAYAEAGSYAAQISIQDAQGSSVSATATATVSDAALTVAGQSFSVQEGSAFSGVAATFTDANPLSATSDFTATIAWGDGHTSVGTITQSGGVFSVSGSYTYAEAGSYSVQISVNDVEGSTGSATAAANISDAALSATASSVTAQEGSVFNGAVATFTDANPLSTASDFTATVNWGDGHTSTASITLSAGTYTVSSSHAYAEAGSFAVQVSIQDAQGSSTSTSATATISDVALSASGQAFSVQEGSGFSGVVATFTDANALATTADFSATITWGDGQTSTSTISQNAGVFSVSASHTYAEAGAFTVQIAVHDVEGSSVSASTTATVSDAALTATGQAVSVQEGSAFSGVVATFTDANPLATAADFSATVTWGDGQTSTATVTLSGGTFSVSASHTWAEAGSYTIQVSILDAQGSSASTSAAATISDAALSAAGQSFSVQEGTVFSGVVTTFTDGNPLSTTADFSATVTWGDGQTSTGTISQNAGVFSVAGSHTYAEAGSYSVQVSILDAQGSSVSAAATGSVSDAALSATGGPLTGQEGSLLGGVIATFTDANSLSTPGDFSATVSWGDGQTSVGTISQSAGVFSVSASHAYAEAGSFTVQISILDAQGSTASATVGATISDAPLTASGHSFSVQEGTTYSGAIATFTDGNALATAADFSATITWGDGQTSTASISLSAGVFSVSASHAYAEAGSYAVQVSITDAQGSSASASATATISDAALSASGQPFNVQEGSSFSGVVATFSDPNALATTADFSATVTWGDGQTGTGTITQNAGVFSVSASHTYAEAGSYTVQIAIQDAQGSSASTTAPATVSDAALTAAGQAVSLQEGSGFSGVVATFTDANPQATAADFSATVTWGDGQTSTATISLSGGTFTVSASHTWAEAGSYTIQVSILDAQGSSASTSAAATISDAALSAAGQSFSIQEGSSYSGTLATFTDANPLSTTADFSATITWGDGQTSTATISQNTGVFSVAGSHAYAEAGSYAVQVSIHDVEGSTASPTASATVSDATVTASGHSFAAQEGAAYSGAIATFTDANALATAADFSATITWGDGQTSTATISLNGSVFSVSASHAYAEAGSYAVQVSITDAQGSTASASATATISDAALSASAPGFSVQEGSGFNGVVATFTDANALATAADLTATITWGDGQTATGTITQNAGVFSVTASHTYAEAGSYTVQMAVQDAQGSSSSTTATATVSDAALTAAGQAVSLQEGSAFSGVVATFTDANPQATAADFSATVTWGDGQTSTATVALSAGTFSVSANHTWKEAGSYTIQVSIMDAQGSSASTSATATISDAALSAAGQSFSVQEGTSYSGALATFTDGNPLSTTADFSATITWGDGQTSTATISQNAGVYSVSASHVYAEAGSYTVQISIHDVEGSTASPTATATVSDATLSASGHSFSAQEGTTYSGAIATFTDANALSTPADVSATVTWGDGQTSTATISLNAGVFSVSASHAYAEAGSYAVQVSIQDAQGSTASASATATISDAALSASGQPFSVQEGSAFSGVVGTFTDANPLATTADLTATITWGDGQTATGTITLNAGVFSVTATHTYAEAGSYTVQMAIQDAQGSSASTTATASVPDAALTATGQAVSIQEGSAFNGLVATFTDANLLATAADFSATVTWGDGQTSTATISLSGGTFSVSASHAWKEAGSYTIQVSILDAQGSSASTSATATISDAALSAAGQSFSVQEGTAYSGVVGTFTDGNSLSTAADFSGTITWGDGHTSAGTITGSGGLFSVSASHAYTEAGSYAVQISIQDVEGSTASAAASAAISDAPLAASGRSVGSQEGSVYSGVVATFTDGNPLSTTGDFSATISWGDGQTSTAAISLNAGIYSVSATHTYAEAGSYTVQVAIQDVEGSSASTSGTATITDAPLSASGGSFSIQEGSPYSGVVATFTDGNASAPVSDFSATITWGDGQTSTGTISVNAGVFSVSAGHTYAEAGSYAIQVSIHDVDGSGITASASATISDAPLSASGQPFSIQEGSTFSGVVTTLTDANSTSTAADFSATINWGDGQTSTGSISLSAGVFSVSGSHAYAEAGSYTAQISVHDIEGQAATATAIATISDAPLSAAAFSFTAQEGASLSGPVATFTDGNPLATASDFTATIAWGDGQTSTGSVTLSGGVFRVFGSHTYAETGPYAYIVAIQDAQGSVAPATAIATITDAPLAAASVAVAATEGNAFSGVVATFTDANPSAPLTDFTATVLWGDGFTSVGSVSQSGGTFSVTGSHTYSDAGTYAFSVQIQDRDGSSASVSSPVTAADAPLTVTGATPSGTEGSPYSGVVATFRDGNPLASLSDFSATIAWGDGQTSAGTITLSGGVFSVSGSHTYADAGSYAATVSIRDIDGSTAVANDRAGIADAPLAPSSGSVSGVEGSTFTGVVASFTDANPQATTADFVARVSWGDGQTSSATVSQSPSAFTIVANHTYARYGTYTVNITITDRDGATASVNETATIADAPLSANGSAFSSHAGVSYSGVIGSITDTNTVATAADLSASVNWGDGTTGTGIIVAAGGGSFQIFGTKTYAAPGTYNVTLAVLDLGGSSSSASTTATISDGVIALTASTIAATQGIPLSAQVATFTFSVAAPSSAFTASIDWGDGAQTSGRIATGSNGSFSVTGAHTYAQEGTYQLKIVVQDTAGTQATVLSGCTVNPAALSGAVSPLEVPVSSLYSGIVARFTDADPALPASNFSAVVSWGDGTSSTCTITNGGAGQFVISAAKTYPVGGEYLVSVQLRDKAGTTFVLQGQASVGDVVVTPLSALTTTEAGASARFAVSLASQPQGDVLIALSLSDASAATLSASTLRFTSQNWNASQVVIVTGRDQKLTGPESLYQVLFSVQSADGVYQTLQPRPLAFVNLATGPSSSTGSSGTGAGSSGIQPVWITALPLDSSSPSATGSNSRGKSPGTSWQIAALLVEPIRFTFPPMLGPEATWLAPAINGPIMLPEAVLAQLWNELAPPELPAMPIPVQTSPAQVARAPRPEPPGAEIPAQPNDDTKEDKAEISNGDNGEWFAGFDQFEGDVDASFSRFSQVITTAALAGLIGSIGYVILSSRGSLWLLSVLTARPLLWKRFDPVEILFAWEEEKERRQREEADKESLQSLVS